MFAIRVLQEPVPEEWLVHGERALLAEIIIDDFHERFALNIDCWKESDYKQQWIEGVKKLMDKKEANSLLVTQFYDIPNTWYAATCWALYRRDEIVYIQNFSVPSDGLEQRLTLGELYGYVTSETRKRGVSEWKVPMRDLELWLPQLKEV